MKRVALAFALSITALTGCKLEAEEKCEQFLSDWCDKEVSCEQRTKDKCLERLKTTIDCSKAVDVPDDIEKCPADIKAKACPLSTSDVPKSCDISIKK